jgi:hypothetical protein
LHASPSGMLLRRSFGSRCRFYLRIHLHILTGSRRAEPEVDLRRSPLFRIIRLGCDPPSGVLFVSCQFRPMVPKLRTGSSQHAARIQFSPDTCWESKVKI